jgi:hypothetical protein
MDKLYYTEGYNHIIVILRIIEAILTIIVNIRAHPFSFKIPHTVMENAIANHNIIVPQLLLKINCMQISLKI